ncbi:hypothetical protein ESA_02476 [Cronobacter sakazakii ATCC BAA-894]|uniref:Uncharacterized protein n=1 Tax=Cronobacter sakazakii (strain ATCC BAA-894) TaxID=290339 RepID=A7MF46_CROS8|nr:hypothetical protein ESA_02476 [Cronobacter sakazakii ATCC BAA-894]
MGEGFLFYGGCASPENLNILCRVGKRSAPALPENLNLLL